MYIYLKLRGWGGKLDWEFFIFSFDKIFIMIYFFVLVVDLLGGFNIFVFRLF